MALAVHRAGVQIEAKYNRIPRGKVKRKKSGNYTFEHFETIGRCLVDLLK